MKCTYFLQTLNIASALTISQNFSSGRYRTSTRLFADGDVEYAATQSAAKAAEDRRARLESELAAVEERTNYLMSKSESLKKDIELEEKKKADEQAALEAKKKADEEAALEMKKRADEQAALEAKKKADEEAALEMKKRADEHVAKGRFKGEEDVSRLKEIIQQYNTSKKSIQKPSKELSIERASTIRPLKQILSEILNDPTKLDLEALKQELSSNNEVRLVTGSATLFSGLVFLRSFLVQRPEKRTSVISQALERVGAGERRQPQPKPYTKVPTTKKVSITATEQSATKSQAEVAKPKPVKPKDLSKPKPKPKAPTIDEDVTDTEAKKPVKVKEEVVSETPQKTLETLPATEEPGSNVKSEAKSTANSNDTTVSKPDEASKTKPTRPFLGGASSYLDSL